VKFLAAGLFLLAAAAPCPAAEEGGSEHAPSLSSWLAQDTATGEWGEYRKRMEDRGVTVSSNYTTDIGGNPVGGLYKTAAYAGCLYGGVSFDLGKLASLKGLNFKVSNYLFNGRNLSNAVGNSYWVQEVYAKGNYYLGELDLSQSLWDDKFVLEIGRLFAGDIFGVSPFSPYYLTSAINGRLGTIPNDIFFPHYQIASWGIRTTLQPDKNWYLIAGAYDANRDVTDPSHHGAHFSLDMDDGCLVVGQVTYKHGHDKEDGRLPGSASLGGYYESSRFADLSDPDRMRRGNYGLYLMADKMIYKGEWPDYERPPHLRSNAMLAERIRKPYHQQTAMPMDRPKGLSVWGGAVFAPQNDINTQTCEWITGLAYQGLPPNRCRDVTAFCFAVGHFSTELGGQSDEYVLELNHRFQLGPWCYLTPDIQYVIHPNGQSDIQDALVPGLEISLNF